MTLPLNGQPVDTLHADYDQAARKLDAEKAGQTQTVRVHYFKLLNDFIDYSQGRGDADYVFWARSEQKRFDEDPVIVLDPKAKLPTKIKRSQAQYQRTLEVSQLKWEQEFIELTERYLDALKGAADRLTAAGNVEQALKVERVIMDIREGEELVSAKANFAAFQRRSSAKEPVPEVKSP